MSDDENWAGKGYFRKRSVDLTEEVEGDLAWIDGFKAQKNIPFVYRELDEEGNERVVQIGEGDLTADGKFIAQMLNGMSIAGRFPGGMSFEPASPPKSRIFRGPKATGFCIDEVSRFSVCDSLMQVPDNFLFIDETPRDKED